MASHPILIFTILPICVQFFKIGALTPGLSARNLYEFLIYLLRDTCPVLTNLHFIIPIFVSKE